MFAASDLADWLDEKLEEHSRQQDEWLIAANNLGNAHPVVVFSSWMNDRIAKFPTNAALFIAGGFIDVLRLGSDLDTSSGWELGKGVFLNVTRLMAVAGPAGRALSAANRYAGLLATAGVGKLTGVPGPCRFVNLNNVISAVKGKTVQLFVSLDDVVAVRSTATPGARGYIGELLEHPTVAPLIKKAGVVWTNLGNLQSMDEVIAAANRYEGAISISLEWTHAGKAVAHRIAIVKNHLGELRYLDYSTGKGFTGYKSLQEMAARAPKWAGIETAALRPEVVLFQSNYLRFLQATDDIWHLSIPVAVGLAWGRGKSLDDAAADIAKSIWEFVKARLGGEAPPPPFPGATAPVLPRPPANQRPPEAANAPRSDWLTGVQYRLKYLAYYDGPIHGKHDRLCREAVIAFQTDQRIMIDGIPGPQTQAELVRVCGF